MSDQSENHDRTTSKRGEAAWKAAKEEIAERNRQTQKAGKEERTAYERRVAALRRTADLRRREEHRSRLNPR